MNSRTITLTSVAALVALAAATIAVLLFATSTASAAPAGRIDREVEFRRIVPNRCTGERVLLTGSAHITGQLQINDNVANGHLHIGVSGTGTGASGQEYVLNGTANGSFSANMNNDQFRVTLTANGKLIAKGPADDLHLHGLMHITMNANGDVTATHFELERECR